MQVATLFKEDTYLPIVADLQVQGHYLTPVTDCSELRIEPSSSRLSGLECMHVTCSMQVGSMLTLVSVGDLVSRLSASWRMKQSLVQKERKKERKNNARKARPMGSEPRELSRGNPLNDNVLGLNQSINQSINQFYSLSWDLCTDPSDYLHVLS